MSNLKGKYSIIVLINEGETMFLIEFFLTANILLSDTTCGLSYCPRGTECVPCLYEWSPPVDGTGRPSPRRDTGSKFIIV